MLQKVDMSIRFVTESKVKKDVDNYALEQCKNVVFM